MSRLAPVVVLGGLLLAASPAAAHRSAYTGTTSQGLPISFVHDDRARGERGGLVDVALQVDFACDGAGNPVEIRPKDGLVRNDGSFTVQNLRATPDGLAGRLRLRGRSAEGRFSWHGCGRPDAVTTGTFTLRRDGPLPRDARGRICSVVGTEGDDVLTGTPFADVICGFGGNDRIAGGRGSDLIDAGPGRDRVAGDRGDDTIVGGSGDDVIDGSAGDDRLDGDAGNDLLSGGSGRDTAVGGTGADIVRGGSGSDRLFGGTGRDALTGGAGNDLLDGGPGRDLLSAGRGDDLVRAIDGARDRILCGRGRDRVLADRIDVRRSC
jgi:Ca2+-binding RTX toxin-like protein